MKTSRIRWQYGVLVQALSCLLCISPMDICIAEIIDEDLVSPPVKPTVPSNSGETRPEAKPSKKQNVEPKKDKGTNQEKKAGKSADEKKAGPAVVQQPATGQTPRLEKPPVHFTSQGLKGLREKGLVELVKDVLVTQGDLKIEADNAQVYFSEESKEVQKIIALGQPVKMSNIDPNTGEKLEAFGNQILFNNAERVVHLEGNARIKKGNNSTIKGKKITYELDSGWIKADKVAGEISPQK